MCNVYCRHERGISPGLRGVQYENEASLLIKIPCLQVCPCLDQRFLFLLTHQHQEIINLIKTQVVWLWCLWPKSCYAVKKYQVLLRSTFYFLMKGFESLTYQGKSELGRCALLPSMHGIPQNLIYLGITLNKKNKFKEHILVQQIVIEKLCFTLKIATCRNTVP